MHTLQINFCFFRRSQLWKYSIKDNCRHEGTNNGLKHGAASVGPSDSLNRSSVLLSTESEYKNNRMEIFHTKQLLQKKTGIDNKTNKFGSHVTRKFEFLVSNEISKSKSYISERVSKDTWYLTWKLNNLEEHLNSTISSVIPVFKIIHKITYQDEFLRFSFPSFNIDVFPCRHVINVAHFVPGFPGISYHDISVKY